MKYHLIGSLLLMTDYAYNAGTHLVCHPHVADTEPDTQRDA